MTGQHDSYVCDICTFALYNILYKIRSFDPFASHLFLEGTTCDNIWREYKLNRAVRLWPCKCLEVIGLHGFLFVEFDTSSSVICHVSLVRFLLAHFYMQDML